jgi:hypothetical protein
LDSDSRPPRRDRPLAGVPGKRKDGACFFGTEAYHRAIGVRLCLKIRRRHLLAASVLSALAILVGAAGAERSQEGNLIVSLNGGISPRTLPRGRPAPVAVQLAGRVQTADRSPLPRVNWIRLELAWRGVLDTHGLPVCPPVRLRSTSSRQALEACGPSRVGHGRLFAKVFVPNQAPIRIHAHLTAFNGRTAGGRPEVLVHAYSPRTPSSFVIRFRVHRNSGAFRTVLVALIRRDAGPWPHVANFEIVVSRHFGFRGKMRSYLSASCPVPKGFTAGFLSFARATYTFQGGEQLTTESVRSCRAR